ncbi:lysine-sensitive aspartokinase 3 [Rhodohalobacter mucosus]|uniref:Aspartokinase n=1 Tax=Rhodohalobacter mucosus TaxID=2079485 RepID=A0A316TV42_9BACT|nr:lysine-sensitive aspartokinase 3 [Rhodohalobacter mucosus]PWN06234.1 lysine-sensitive aspartokinase 3 [Rhodohalobacter mucosus]
MPDLLKVAKFGGTSMADLDAMKRCARIVTSDPDKKVIVVSATSGTTNLLSSLFDHVETDQKMEIVDKIRKKHLEICTGLVHSTEVEKAILQVMDSLVALVQNQHMMTPRIQDEILSHGELLSSAIFTGLLKEYDTGEVDTRWLDARKIITTDRSHTKAQPDISAIAGNAEDQLIPHLESVRFVTQGFIGSSPDGTTTTLGRGGSDYSAALFAEAIHADVLEIWTDVTAVYTTDPRVVPAARPITEISFDEAAELSVFGAKVLHPATMVPAVRKNIKVYVGSSMKPQKPGTWIMKDTRSKPVIRAISLRRNQTLVTVKSPDMLHRHGFLAKLFDVLSRHQVSVDLVTTSEVSVSLTVDTDIQSTERDSLNEDVLSELRTFSQVDVEKDLSLVALIGNNLHATSGLSGPVFGLLEDVNVRLICHGASSHNLCFLVSQTSAEKVVQVLHNRFIK